MKQIVTIGGGTGSYTVLTGLKKIPDARITAIVAMTDDGGSTGTLRDELGVLPPGDVRQCLAALADDEVTMRALMSYRFDSGSLRGHSFGNILLAALEKVTGDFTEGVEIASKILNVRGTVVPVTRTPAQLSVQLEDGTVVSGQRTVTATTLAAGAARSVRVDARINPDAARAIASADAVIIGPGSHIESILPCLVVEGMQHALQNSHAKLIYVPNLTNKQRHTPSYAISDYVEDIEHVLTRTLDHIIVNTGTPTEEQLHAYEQQEGTRALVKDDMQEDPRVLRDDILSRTLPTPPSHDSIAHTRALIRHDSDALARVLWGTL